VLETLKFLKHETSVWFEITSLLIPGENDSEAQLHWGPNGLPKISARRAVAFHRVPSDFKMLDHSHTPPATLTRAREIALSKGLHHVYTGNVHDRDGGSTFCPNCHALVIERDWYELGR